MGDYSLFNPYEKDDVMELTTRLRNLQIGLREAAEVDADAIIKPLDLSTLDIRFIEARLELLTKAGDAVDEAAANIAGVSKMTELLGEWRDWWSAQ